MTDDRQARTADVGEALERAQEGLGSFLWLGNNLHNWDTPTFREMFVAALTDARRGYDDIAVLRARGLVLANLDEGLLEAAVFAVEQMALYLWDGDTNNGGDDDLVVVAHDTLRAALAAFGTDR